MVYKKIKEKPYKLTTEQKQLINKEKKFKIEYMALLITIVSSTFLLGGYFYNYLLFSKINISVSNFLTLTDYIETSLNVLILPFILMCIVFILVIPFFIRISKKKQLIATIIITICFLLYFIKIYTGNNVNISTYIMGLSLIFITFPLYVSNSSFSERVISIYLICLILYFAMIEITVNFHSKVIDNYKANKNTSKIGYKFTTLNDKDFKADLYIKSTSKYHFFYSTDENNQSYSVIIPTSQIKKIKIIEKIKKDN